MMRFAGIILCSFLVLLPAWGKSPSANKPLQQCPSGSVYCAECGKCAASDVGCKRACSEKQMITLQKKENAVFVLPEGAIVSCEENKTLVPVPSSGHGAPTQWTCGERQ